MTCYDLRFPELARSPADAGAQVLLVWVEVASDCVEAVPGSFTMGSIAGIPERCKADL
jgi:hypothetical protein